MSVTDTKFQSLKSGYSAQLFLIYLTAALAIMIYKITISIVYIIIPGMKLIAGDKLMKIRIATIQV